jgi:hypothetical protein
MTLKHWSKTHWLRILLLALGLTAGAFLIWALSPQQPVEAALAHPPQVKIIEEKGWLIIRPAEGMPHTGLIFYPGGHVDARVYNRPLSQIAQQGVLVVVVPMPLNLAFLGANQAEAVIAAYPRIETWALGGHSLGGAMAARFADRHPGQVQGLVLWGAYPPASVDLTPQIDLAVTIIYASQDGLSTPEEVRASAAQFPPGARFCVIEGGNHAQFGDYGAQSGDLPAAITPEAQQDQAIRLTMDLLTSLNTNPITPDSPPH